MRDQVSELKQDVAFLRTLAEGSAGAGARDGATLVAIGIVFSLVALEYWAVDAHLTGIPQSWRSWLWLDGLAVFLVTLGFIQWGFKGRATGPGSRAISAGWTVLGAALGFAVVGLIAAGFRLALPSLAAWVFPIVLFTLFGASWAIAFAVQRRARHALASGGCGVAAIACGALIASPLEWLALAAGLVLLVALPGALIIRADRAR